MPTKPLFPDAVRDLLVRRFNNQHQIWLAGGGTWPLSVPLGVPTEKAGADDPAGVRAWVAAWSGWRGAGEVLWEQRQWMRLGAQRFPVSVVVTTPVDIASLVDQRKRWTMAVERYQRMTNRWPGFKQSTALASKFNVLADYSAADFERLFSLIEWIEANPTSSLYLRQLPIAGLDTKWIEQRTGVVAGLLRALRNTPENGDFYEVCGLKKPPHRIRVRILCPKLRKIVGGIRDLEVPASELTALPISPASAVIVENLETGLALPDIPGTICVMKLGNAVSTLDALPWLREAKVIYWGDIDTYGYAILDRARRVLPHLRSVLMDEATLLANRPLWGQETVQCTEAELQQLTAQERVVYSGLRCHKWGEKVRLEQERISWKFAVAAVVFALLGDSSVPEHHLGE